ncbi:hypothetical protein BDV26DRAFT_272220 [Aspergillus bertholletiae]|uniref:Protein kinase domain-containing protein n=1 Tax=Aspergillus bertholletiae TaxID=1226010 RepID=A0A5N7AU57_9EURO|nr:hypothetical protein BDV26DRAFT_272220 [Aspergillus bertholletiae]
MYIEVETPPLIFHRPSRAVKMTFSLDFNTLNDKPKPDLPYVKGYEFSVREFFPPEPQNKPTFTLSPDEGFQRQNIDVLTRCFARKPLSGRLGSRTLRLKINEPIRVGDENRSQIVLVDAVSGQAPATTMVAKLYDPLYYDHSNDDVDPFLFVDIEFTRETAAYTHLHSHGETHVPEYYGSYTMDISHSNRQFRTVRLILFQYIAGNSMAALQPHGFRQVLREAILEQIINVESRLYESNLWHRDTSPRNIIIRGLGSNVHVTIIDFGHASIGRSRDPKNDNLESEFLPGIYINPILRWYKSRGREPVSSFEEWINWEWNSWLFNNYHSDIEKINPEVIERWLPPSVREEVLAIVLMEKRGQERVTLID